MMIKKKMAVMICLPLLAVWLSACGSREAPQIVCGSDWIKSRAVVVDTGSVFRISDPLIIQFRYGKAFDFQQLEWLIYKGTLTQRGTPLITKTTSVSQKQGSYTIQGISLRGGYMSAMEMLHAEEPGAYVIEFRVAGKMIAEKQIELVRNSEKAAAEP